jgi:excisionase family DNA binding protein
MSGHGRKGTERLLTPLEVASIFRVDTKTVTRWARSGKLSSVRTLGGHRRYPESEVLALLEKSREQRHTSNEEGQRDARD